MTVLLEYVTAPLEYFSLLLKGISPKVARLSPPLIMSIFTIIKLSWVQVLAQYSQVNSIPTWPPNLEQFEMKYVHRLIAVARSKLMVFRK